MSHYNPTLEEIRFVYATNGALLKNRAWDESVEDATRRLSSQFDNWLSAHDAEEPEWEVEYQCRIDPFDWSLCTDDPRFCPTGSERRTRKVTAWVPVK